MAKESKNTIEQLSKIPQTPAGAFMKATAGMSVFNNGITLWPTQETAKRFSSHVKPFPFSRLYSDFNGIGWKCKIARDSEAFKANRTISKYLYEKNITVSGEEFICLEKPRLVKKIGKIIRMQQKTIRPKNSARAYNQNPEPRTQNPEPRTQNPVAMA